MAYNQFRVDQVLIFHSLYTGDVCEVIYRGPAGGDPYHSSIVYYPLSGWQGAIPNTWLRPKPEPTLFDSPQPEGPGE